MTNDYRIDVIPNAYDVSYKRRRSGRLLNLRVDAQDVAQASRRALEMLRCLGEPTEGARAWREYGISRATRVLTRTITFGAAGVFFEWRDGNGTCHEKTEVPAEEVRKMASERGWV